MALTHTICSCLCCSSLPHCSIASLHLHQCDNLQRCTLVIVASLHSCIVEPLRRTPICWCNDIWRCNDNATLVQGPCLTTMHNNHAYGISVDGSSRGGSRHSRVAERQWSSWFRDIKRKQEKSQRRSYCFVFRDIKKRIRGISSVGFFVFSIQH